MARRMWVALGAAAVLVAPVACSSDDGGEVSTGPDDGGEPTAEAIEAAPTAAFMARVAENTSGSPAFEFSMAFDAQDVPELGSGTLMTAEGTFTDDGERGEMTIDMSPMLDAIGGELEGAAGAGLEDLLGGLAEPWQVVVDGDTTYMSGGFLVSVLGAETTWISVPSGDASADPTGGMGDPDAFLDLLGEAGEVTEEGTEEVGGVETTHYVVDVDLEALAGSAAEEAGEELPDIPGLSGTTVTIDVWVDEGAQEVRRMALLLDGSALGEGATGGFEGSVRLTVDITPLDEPVEVDVPDPADVTPIEELGGGLLGGLGG